MGEAQKNAFSEAASIFGQSQLQSPGTTGNMCGLMENKIV